MKRKSPDPVYLSTMLLKRCILQTLLPANEAESNVRGKCIICKRKQFGLDGNAFRDMKNGTFFHLVCSPIGCFHFCDK